ncbi:hypothetical protein F66182_9611 [Fusarium sp. NRRL 66182]|nr:hypothetical protein F66182_9611 [Fusarium sp. NRRL 66182]
MSHRRTASASQIQGGRSGYRGSGPASYDAADARRESTFSSGITYTPGSVFPRHVSLTDTGHPLQGRSSCDLSLEGPSPHGTYYATADPRTASSYPGPVSHNRADSYPYANGDARGSQHPGNDPHSENDYPRSGSYSGNFSQPGRYATSYQNRRAYSASHRGRNLRQTYPSDHYDTAGNYIGPPNVDSYSGGLVSFPRIPESEPSSSSPELALDTSEFYRQSSASSYPRRNFSEQLVNGVRNLFNPEPAAGEQHEILPQPARTGVYLFCRHYLIEECACITPLELSGDGDYCQRCWEGRCDGPRPPGSVSRRLLW